MKTTTYLLIIALFIFSCTNTENTEVEDSLDATVIEENTEVSINIDQLKEKVINWRGGSYMKQAGCQNGNITIVYVNDFEDLKSAFPMLTTTEEDYKKAMGKPYHIDKMLAELPVKIFLKFRDANSISLKIPFGGTDHTIKITKKEIEDFSGKSFDEIEADYTVNYANKYVFDEVGRQEFVSKFANK